MNNKIRLSQEEKDVIVSVLHEADPDGEIYVFGSRTDIKKRGGDIDIFFETKKKLTLKHRLLLEYRMRSQCDTKIDLLVKSADEPDQPIHDIAKQGVHL
ncbi:MAG: nucleotidyltransferase domain-containing protein [Oceanospirillales bacterium]|nr:MAG: nucleotidyltransferase domain-containing protein [Oceanospirillales bacterium]